MCEEIYFHLNNNANLYKEFYKTVIKIISEKLHLSFYLRNCFELVQKI
jgi:hypothetical protein